jgi:hypothetical protein
VVMQRSAKIAVLFRGAASLAQSCIGEEKP